MYTDEVRVCKIYLMMGLTRTNYIEISMYCPVGLSRVLKDQYTSQLNNLKIVLQIFGLFSVDSLVKIGKNMASINRCTVCNK